MYRRPAVSAGRLTGSYSWPQTRIRRQGLLGYQNLRMRGLFKSMSVYVALFLVFALTYVWSHIKVMELGYHIRQLEETQEKLKEQNRALMVEAATLRSPQRLENIAKELGLKRPDEHKVYIIK